MVLTIVDSSLEIFFIVKFFSIFNYLRSKKRGTKRQRAPICWFTPYMSAVTSDYEQRHELGRSPGELERSGYLGHYCCFLEIRDWEPEVGIQPGHSHMRDEDGPSVGLLYFLCETFYYLL